MWLHTDMHTRYVILIKLQEMENSINPEFVYQDTIVKQSNTPIEQSLVQ